MRVFVVAATGAIAARLVPELMERGHEVLGTSRSPGSARPASVSISRSLVRRVGS
jgi:uncharacterized protein YbjT (DUF2867 family)